MGRDIDDKNVTLAFGAMAPSDILAAPRPLPVRKPVEPTPLERALLDVVEPPSDAPAPKEESGPCREPPSFGRVDRQQSRAPTWERHMTLGGVAFAVEDAFEIFDGAEVEPISGTDKLSDDLALWIHEETFRELTGTPLACGRLSAIPQHIKGGLGGAKEAVDLVPVLVH